MFLRSARGGSAPIKCVEPIVQVEPAAPGIFTQDSSGKGFGSILNSDYTINGPAHPAVKGSVVMVYGTGFGAPVTPMPDGLISPAAAVLSGTYTAQINGQTAEIEYAGVAPDLIDGAAQINIRIPPAAPSGADNLTITRTDAGPGHVTNTVQIQVQ